MPIEFYPQTAERTAHYGQPIRLERAPHVESAVLVWPVDDPEGDFAFVHIDAREHIPDTWLAEHINCDFSGAQVCRTYVSPEGAFPESKRRRYLNASADIMVRNRMAHSQNQRRLEELRRERKSPLARPPEQDWLSGLLRKLDRRG